MFNELSSGGKKITILFAALQFLYYFTFFWLIQNVYFLEHGIDYKQLSILLGVWSLSMVVFEIPSGILADKFGRKNIVIIGKLAFFLGIVLFSVYKTFYGFLIGMVFWGIHESFISGALEALVYDELKRERAEGQFKKVLSIATVSREVGLGVGVLVAGFVTQLGVQYNLIGSLIITFTGFFLTFFLPAPVPTAKREEDVSKVSFATAFKQIMNNNGLVRLLMFSITVLLSYQVITEYLVVSLKSLGVNYIGVGIFAFFEMLFFTFGAYLSRKTAATKNGKTLLSLSLFMAAGMVVITTEYLPVVVTAWLFLRVVKAYAEIVSTAEWQEGVRSEDRATTGSIKSFIMSILYIPAAFLFGVIADKFSLFNAFYVAAGISCMYLAVVLVQKLRTRSL